MKKLLVLGLVGCFGALLIFSSFSSAIPELTPRFSARILRDKKGIPHIFGKRDADVAYGLAYAHAEDSFPLIQGSMAAARGRLSLLKLSKEALGNDYYAGLFKIRHNVDSNYEKLSPRTRELLDAYAEGLNVYAAKHPSEVEKRLYPFTGKDIAAGFVHKLPLFFGMGDVLKKLINGETDHGTLLTGSNAHAVLHSKSTDGITRLNINSHQPWEGPVAWYEVQLHSDEGWNMTGGTFPGAPFVLMGHNDHLGWAHTVNHPDLIDIYRLEVNTDETQYRVDGEWLPLERFNAEFEIGVGPLTIPWKKPAWNSVFGPVVKTPQGFFAIRYAGMDRTVLAVEEWYRLNKARNFSEWKAAMSMQAIPLFHTVYADFDNIFYVYTALLPLREKGLDWRHTVPGNTKQLIWRDYLSFDKLPSSHNPPSGFIASCNATPFGVTEKGNPEDHYDESLGIDRRVSSRILRSLALFKEKDRVSREDFLEIKFDRVLDAKSPVYEKSIFPLLGYEPRGEREKEGIKLLRQWDRRFDSNSRGASLATLVSNPFAWEMEIRGGTDTPNPIQVFRESVQFLWKHYGKVDVPLGTLQRLKRGVLDLPLEGGPDVMNAVYSQIKGSKLVGEWGDSHILFVEFSKEGVKSSSVQPFGSSTRKDSPHYTDWSEAFLKQELSPTLRSEADIRNNLEREYTI